MSLKNLARSVTPPFIWNRLSKCAHAHEEDPDYLFDGEAQFFKKATRAAAVYIEYGVGKSTLWVNRHSDAFVIGVDSSEHWIRFVEGSCADPSRVSLMHADVGPIGDWGRPLTLKKRENFLHYAVGIWNEPQAKNANVILIDGRFRISCFFASMAFGREGSTVIFDDYVMRPVYSVVEEFLTPERIDGRQAIFSIPALSATQRAKMLRNAKHYIYLLD